MEEIHGTEDSTVVHDLMANHAGGFERAPASWTAPSRCSSWSRRHEEGIGVREAARADRHRPQRGQPDPRPAGTARLGRADRTSGALLGGSRLFSWWRCCGTGTACGTPPTDPARARRACTTRPATWPYGSTTGWCSGTRSTATSPSGTCSNWASRSDSPPEPPARAILSGMPTSEVELVFAEGLERHTPNSITDVGEYRDVLDGTGSWDIR